MLVHLHVKNLAIIDEVEVDFSDRLNILTGETGAGKSILIDSINIALGQKISADMIRKGEDQAFVELVFQIENKDTLRQLEAMDIPVEEPLAIVSRRIRGGRSLSKVNGVSVTASALKSIAGLLIDIHGQHEHQSLLYKSKHLEILDRYGMEKEESLLQKIKEAHKRYAEILKRIKESSQPEEERNREISFMEYEKQEIEDAHLKKGEDTECEAAYRKMANAGAIMEDLAAVYQMTGGEESVSDLTGRAMRQLNHAVSLEDSLQSLGDQLSGIDSLLNDFNRELSAQMADFEFDTAEFKSLEDRLNQIHGLKAKYGESIEQIEAYYQNLVKKLEHYKDYERYIGQLKEEREKEEEILRTLCEALSEIRKKNAIQLEKEIRKALKELNFEQAQFQIAFKRLDRYGANGFDEVEFLISTNPGEDVKPLSKVASGGELSRIMLAIKSVLAEKDEVDTLIFDEIDTGISGRTAQKVSERLAIMATSHQVISITHLPQIAAMADEHYIIEKTTDGKSTKTGIHALNFDGSVSELARMLGGSKITDAVLKSAKEMKLLASEFKKLKI